MCLCDGRRNDEAIRAITIPEIHSYAVMHQIPQSQFRWFLRVIQRLDTVEIQYLRDSRKRALEKIRQKNKGKKGG